MALRIVDFFFTTDRVKKRIGEAKAAGLSMIGAFVQRHAKGLIRSAGKKGLPSKPGKPPKNRIGTLKNLLYFALDPIRDSVVIGPEIVPNIGPEPVPGALEHGGVIQFNVFDDGKGKVKIDKSTARRSSSPFRYVPVWKATDADREESLGIFTKMDGNHAINFYILQKPTPQTVRKRIAARPYMIPALEHERRNPKLRSVWANSVKP